ncbi:immunity protein Imm33 domain-containing protein [Burkholderia plantarii]|uniref:immunity protein Imm33 domain-containing protein n=1 Tax=Burkholderia plantarii TaxID=41899 RepID=UPI00272D75E1|nr:hypothetical protein [Burkholderia plantarii]
MSKRKVGVVIMDDDKFSSLRDDQIVTCEKYNLPQVEPEAMVAIALETIGKNPTYGTRIILPEGGNVSWFFHCGEYSDKDDFYKPIHIEHLREILPSVLKYLRLPHGAKFIIDDNGFEDVWMVQ